MGEGEGGGEEDVVSRDHRQAGPAPNFGCNLSERVLQSIWGTLIRINPRKDSVAVGQIGLPFGAAEGIRRICDCAENLAGGVNPRD